MQTDIIKMAREAGIRDCTCSGAFGCLERFAALVAAHDVTMRHKIVLGHELLTEIYQAMGAKREFVGLTEEDRLDIWKKSSSIDGAINATEAKLREKNS